MRCHICNTPIENIRFNRVHNEWEPCSTCLEVIYSCFNDFPDDYETGEATFNPNEEVPIEEYIDDYSESS